MSTSQLNFEISPDELKKKLDAGHVVTVVDVREPWEWQTARIEGARHIPMGDIPSRVHQELDPDEHIVVYCHHGIRSADVTMWMRNQGFENVQSLRGGIDRWSREVDAKVPLY